MKKYARIRRRHVPWIVLAVSLFVFAGEQLGWFSSIANVTEQTQPGLYKIDHFVDGDTIAVDMNGKVETIRLIGVDTPETHRPNTPVQCYGKDAAAFTKKLIGSNNVRLGSDSLSSNRDRYNRLLRYVYLPDGTLVNERLIQRGFGFAYTYFPFTKSKQFSADQDQAKAQHLGLWSSCKITYKSDGQPQTNPVGS